MCSNIKEMKKSVNDICIYFYGNNVSGLKIDRQYVIHFANVLIYSISILSYSFTTSSSIVVCVSSTHKIFSHFISVSHLSSHSIPSLVSHPLIKFVSRKPSYNSISCLNGLSSLSTINKAP